MILGIFALQDRAADVRMSLRESERRRVVGIVGLVLIRRDREGRLDLLEARKESNWIEDRSAIRHLMCGAAGAAGWRAGPLPRLGLSAVGDRTEMS
jgi:hypothetical protein